MSDEMAQAYELKKGEYLYRFIAYESGDVRIQAFIGSLRTRDFTTDNADARRRYRNLVNGGFTGVVR